MKTIYSLLAILIFSLPANAICRIDTVLNFTYPIGTSVKEIQSRLINTYDPSNNLIQEVSQNWDNATLRFVNDYKYNFVNDASGNKIEELYQIWDNVSSAWVNGNKRNFFYDALGNDTLTLNYTWLSSSAWRNIFRQRKIFDAIGNMVGAESQRWDASSSSLQNYLKQTNTFDAFKNQITGLSEQWNVTTGAWENLSKVTNLTDVSGRIVNKTYQGWDVTTTTWLNTIQYLYTYNTSGKTTEIKVQLWDISTASWADKTKQFNTYNSAAFLAKDSTVDMSVLGTWVNREQKSYVYNAANKLLERKTEEWNSAASAWLNYEKRTNEYDASNYLIAYDQYRTWNNTSASYDNHTRSENKCTDIPTSVVETSVENDARIYPNPITNNTVFIDSKTEQTFSIVNLNGQSLQSGNLKKGRNNIDVNGFSSGLYFIKIGNEVRKIIIQ